MTNKRREEWIVKNVSDRTISLGIPHTKALRPNQSTELLDSTSKEELQNNPNLIALITKGTVTLTILLDGNTQKVITSNNPQDLNATTDSKQITTEITNTHHSIEHLQTQLDDKVGVTDFLLHRLDKNPHHLQAKDIGAVESTTPGLNFGRHDNLEERIQKIEQFLKANFNYQ